MKFNIPLNKNTVALMITGFVTFGFFFSGLFEVLNYMIVKLLLFSGFILLFVIALNHIFKNGSKKNRPEELPQDDLH